jgi:hypothetical protein
MHSTTESQGAGHRPDYSLHTSPGQLPHRTTLFPLGRPMDALGNRFPGAGAALGGLTGMPEAAMMQHAGRLERPSPS